MRKRPILLVKVGSSSLSQRTRAGHWRLHHLAFRRIGSQLLELRKQGNDVVIVSSGAITAGMGLTKRIDRPNKETHMADLQALASIGNPCLVAAWGKALPGCIAGSVLLTRHSLDTNSSERNQAVRVVQALLDTGSVPIVNENDAIADEEIAYGDNDILAATLAARLAQAGRQVKLVLLSDVDGVYEDITQPDSLIPIITDVAAAAHFANGSGSVNGTGGMVTKFAAADIAMQAGVHMWIVNGQKETGIIRALAGDTGTHFIPLAG